MNPLTFIFSVVACFALASAARAGDAQQWSVHEIAVEAESDFSNAYTDLEVTAAFTGPDGAPKTVRGFWDGGKSWKVRFTPTTQGEWKYAISSQPADAGLTREGTLTATAAAAGSRGFLRRDVEFPTTFAFDDGARFFMWGTTYYDLLLIARAGERWKEAIDGAMRYGMNKARFSLAGGERNRKSGGYEDSEPFRDKEHRQLDLEHWRTADRVIAQMNERGFLADVIFFWRMNETEVTSEKRAADERYLRYAMARYAAYPNVIWCMVNEWNYSSVPRDYWNDLGRLVREEDPWSRRGAALRVHSIHQQTRPDWNFDDQTWPSHAILQLGVRNRGASVKVGDEWKTPPKGTPRFTFGDDWGNHSIVRNWTGKHPVVNDEFGYIGEPFDDTAGGSKRDNKPAPFTREKHRRTMWGIAVGGGYAATGDKTDYGADGSPYFSANWHDAPEYGDVKRLVDFFTTRGIEYWKMAPHNEFAKPTKGARIYVLAEPGREYVVYAAADGDFTVTLAPGRYTASRFDPATGEETALGEINGGAQALQLPAGTDGVLRISRQPSPQ